MVRVLLVIIVCFSCGERNRVHAEKLPTHGNAAAVDYITSAASEIGLDSLEYGYKQTQLRIWLGHSMARVKHVVILKQNYYRWYAEIVQYSSQATDQDTTSRFTPIKIQRDVQPKSSWEVYSNSEVFKKLIESIKSASIDVQSDCGGADGLEYHFEFATPTLHKIQSLCELKDTYATFIRSLETEFDVKYTK